MEKVTKTHEEKKHENKREEYVRPTVKKYTKEEILEKVGPAHACSGSPCGIVG